MFVKFVKQLPDKKFVAANAAFWLFITVLSSDIAHRALAHRGQHFDWLTIFFEHIPYYANWLILVPLTVALTRSISLDTNSRVNFALKNLAVMIFIMSAYWVLSAIEIALLERGQFNIKALTSSFQALMKSAYHIDIIIYLAIVFLSYLMSYYKDVQEEKARNRSLQHQLTKVELETLKSQLDPHFLFNSLNTVSSLIRLEQKDEAVRALSELSSMLRKVLENNQSQMTSIIEEMDFINSYLAIQKMRFGEKLNIEMDISAACLDKKIPFMLLQPLVENAVQHGSQLESDHNPIKLTGECDGKNIRIKLINSRAKSNAKKGFGIGVENCRMRLNKIYGDNFTLSAEPLSEELFEMELVFPTEPLNQLQDNE